MRILSYIIWAFVLYLIGIFSEESPHGKDFKMSCTTCHTTNGWQIDKKTFSFDHSTTKMPLIGQHNNINCRLCHPTLVFSEAKSKTECVSCHKDIHSQTVGNSCDKCHTPSSWIVKNILEIHQQSRFPLLGVHTMTECQKCHKSESLHRYDVQGVECIDCHRKDYMSTTNPNHLTSSISTDCSQCHKIFATVWGGSGFNHDFFPLKLGHLNVACNQCHINNNFTNTPTDCYSCHKTNYLAANNPVHSGGCFSTNCTQCHNTNPGWAPLTFQHNSYFALTLGHANVACNKCHTNNNCTIPTDCYSCHKPNYDATTNPKHISACYSTNCIQCHTTNPGWAPSTFNHNSYFPISSGTHSGFACNQCHTNPADCSFSCIACHTHNQAQMNSSHSSVSGYSWTSSACYSCHPTGHAGKKKY